MSWDDDWSFDDEDDAWADFDDDWFDDEIEEEALPEEEAEDVIVE